MTTRDTESVAPSPDSTFDWLEKEFARRAEAGIFRRLRTRGADDDFIALQGNDYLGLSQDKRVIEAAVEATRRWGTSSTGSRVVSGSTALHAEFEEELADFTGAEAALVFSSGYMANLSAITTLSGPESVIVTDQDIHASLIDGCRLSRSEVSVAPHLDVKAMGEALRNRQQPNALVITDSVFSVDGDLAPLSDVIEVCRRHQAALLVDDAHGFGVLGEGGRGATHAAGLSSAPDVVTSLTLSKSLGAQGGAVFGARRAIRQMIESARTFIFDTGLAPANVAAALAALRIMRAEPDLVPRARDIAAEMSTRLRERGFTVSLPDAAVVSVRAPSPKAAEEWATHCAERGVRVGCFRPPAVTDGISRIRIASRADLTPAQVDRALEVITETAPEGAVTPRRG